MSYYNLLIVLKYLIDITYINININSLNININSYNFKNNYFIKYK